MFCMALTMQSGLGMAPWQSGNSFIALGVPYFISAGFAPRLIARYSTSAILLTRLAIQLVGLVALIATFRHWGMQNTALTLAPATSRRLHPGSQRLPDGGNGHDGGAGSGHAAYAPSSVFTGRQGLSGDKIKLPEFA